MAGEMERVDRKEGGSGEGEFLHIWRGLVGEAGRVDRKGGEGGNGEGDFTDGMPGWRYFSRATPSHPASVSILRNVSTFISSIFMFHILWAIRDTRSVMLPYINDYHVILRNSLLFQLYINIKHQNHLAYKVPFIL